jgi:DNA modification methylase
MIKEQKVTENYAIYNSDCMYVLPTMADESIDLSVYSPPFAGLYNYSSSDNDFSNCETREQFLKQYEFLIAEISRVTKPGRITAVHCTDVMNKDGGMWDFPHEIITLHEKYGFKYRNKITIWKEPLKVRMRTMVRSLMHKLIVEDSTECFTAMPDYVLIFKKNGINEVPVTHPVGLTYYAGAQPLLPMHGDKYGTFEQLK